MTFIWSAVLPRSRMRALGCLRLNREVQILTPDAGASGPDIWLAGLTISDELKRSLASLPDVACYRVLPDQQLIREGTHLPCGYLPKGHWGALSDYLLVKLPIPALAAEICACVNLELVRGGAELDANILVASSSDWYAFVNHAASIRLKPLTFALATTDAAVRGVIVRGIPLPPIAGEHYIEQCGIATPAGYRLSPPVQASVLRDSLAIDADDLVLLHPKSNWELIAAECFVQASRSAVRTSVAGA